MIIAANPPKEIAQALAIPGGLLAPTLHFTMFFLGESSIVTQEKYTEYVQAMQDVCYETPSFNILIEDTGRFEKVRMTTDPEGNMVPAEKPTDVIFLKGVSEELVSLRDKLAEVLDERDLYFSKMHKTFVPHMSLKYVPHGDALELPYSLPIEFTVTSIELWGDGSAFKQKVPLRGG